MSAMVIFGDWCPREADVERGGKYSAFSGREVKTSQADTVPRRFTPHGAL